MCSARYFSKKSRASSSRKQSSSKKKSGVGHRRIFVLLFEVGGTHNNKFLYRTSQIHNPRSLDIHQRFEIYPPLKVELFFGANSREMELAVEESNIRIKAKHDPLSRQILSRSLFMRLSTCFMSSKGVWSIFGSSLPSRFYAV